MFKVFKKCQNPNKVFQGELDWVAQTFEMKQAA